jgi:hypothetical protein
MAPDNRSRRTNKHGKLYAPVAFLIICGAIVFSMSVFFRVSDIRVEGNARYSAKEIADAAGIEKGSNLFFINRFTSVSRIFTQLPYIESAAFAGTSRPGGYHGEGEPRPGLCGGGERLLAHRQELQDPGKI